MTSPSASSALDESGILWKLAAPLTSLVIAIGWVLLVIWRPTTTFHFAPLLVAVGWPYTARFNRGLVLPRSEAIAAVVGGASVSLATTALLIVANKLEGPTFWETSDAPLEAVLMTALGVLWGLRITTKRRRRLAESVGEPHNRERAADG